MAIPDRGGQPRVRRRHGLTAGVGGAVALIGLVGQSLGLAIAGAVTCIVVLLTPTTLDLRDRLRAGPPDHVDELAMGVLLVAAVAGAVGLGAWIF